ncbi:MAG: hypothetical protein ACK41C_01330 [Phenylobacterium sp.]|uniref:hypothetical protein n=1 Tax=Phenylobacterium sp. TaxID=1871053 RepID=UPI0039199FCD
MTLLAWRFAALLIAALSLGPSFAHLLEAPPRLKVWSPELWREATVFNGQFKLFGVLGGPLDAGAIVVVGALAFLMRHDRPGFWLALAAAVLFAASLAVWLSVVAPANSVLATWKPGPIPPDFAIVRNRWETGHIVIATIKIAAFSALALAVAWPSSPRT